MSSNNPFAATTSKADRPAPESTRPTTFYRQASTQIRAQESAQIVDNYVEGDTASSSSSTSSTTTTTTQVGRKSERVNDEFFASVEISGDILLPGEECRYKEVANYIHLSPGLVHEKEFVKVMTTHGTVLITNYRFIFIPEGNLKLIQTLPEASLPLCAIFRLELVDDRNGMGLYVDLVCKDFRSIRLHFLRHEKMNGQRLYTPISFFCFCLYVYFPVGALWPTHAK